ncbi:hypothetical protein K431DRAFT_136976 [Polychaeton citri CBS 116435]|uniref:Mediator of RNA polymerase II transcription subunit 13 n=1 Tax=Polychaeton citri CBS 116435 TaxID=1314669 RepID=A0A9P4Q292_9PEZI|nr:hypothetical protein K431DRAFT_136976 [Polychaeton citri CBS 116435]
MDFIKSCSTNVQVVEDILKTRFRIYQPQDEGAELDTGGTHAALLELRQRKVLCASRDGRIWTFGSDEVEIEDLLHSVGMGLLEEGVMRNVSASASALAGHGSRELFLEAVQGGVGFALARSQDAVRVGSWTWLCCADRVGGNADGSAAVRVYARIAENGALRIATKVDNANLSSLAGQRAGESEDVMLAPSGSLARIVPVKNSDQMGVVDGPSWREAVVKILAAEGVLISKHVEWLRVSLTEGDAPSFAWPASLAFVLAAPPFNDIAGKHNAWKTWFSEGGRVEGFQDLIQQSEDWCKIVPEFEEHLAVPENANTTIIGNNMAAASTNSLGSELGPSPPFMHRPEQQPVGGIYPTPPDGMMPGMSSQQPSTDTVPAKAPAPLEQFSAGMSGGNDVEMSDSLEHVAKRPQSDRNFSLTSSLGDNPGMQGGHDELFGEIGDSIDFGEGDNEVGDADFSFFDEPDTAPNENNGAPVPSEDIPADPVQEVQDSSPTQPSEQQPNVDARDDTSTDVPINESQASQSQDAEAQPVDLSQSQANADDTVSPLPVEEDIVPTKPLSPFDIKERLFPPPIPASVKQHEQQPSRPEVRRNSTFSPITFRENFSLAAQYAIDDQISKPDLQAPYSLSSKRKALLRTERDRLTAKANESDYETSTSFDDSYETDSSVSDTAEAPPRFPWETRKRRRFGGSEIAEAANGDGGYETDAGNDDFIPRSEIDDLLSVLAHSISGHTDGQGLFGKTPSGLEGLQIDVASVLELDGNDLIGISQLIAEQAVTTTGAMAASFGGLNQHMDYDEAFLECRSTLYTVALNSIHELIQGTTSCDMIKLALIKEALPMRSNSTAAGKGQPPRAPQRAEAMAAGPDVIFVPPPYVRVQRGGSHWEMLPPALAFWDTLSLAPASGPKDVRAFCVLPSNRDLRRLAKEFLCQLGMIYESCKFGSHELKIEEERDLGGPPDSLVSVHNDDDDLQSAVKSYVNVCRDLGAKLAKIADAEQGRTLVIYMIDPFTVPYGRDILCACFWILYKAYDNALGPKRSGSCSDLVLQILPIDIVATINSLVLPDFAHTITMAREVYDRCPPASTLDYTSSLPIVTAPAIELASAPPKRITFHLTPDPPSDLLFDGSALHLAYSQSANRQWITAAWVDSTGRYSSTVSFCVRGTTFASIAEDLWERTEDIMSARQAVWRVFIVTDTKLHQSQQQCWRTVVSKPRRQVFSVTLLHASEQPTLQVMPPQTTDGTIRDSLLSLGAGFPTPASTPQASNFGVSPDASGQGSGSNIAGYAAPPTPAPSDIVTSSNLETEPDAQLVDATDESWVTLLDQGNLPDEGEMTRVSCLARGALLKRGESTALTTTSTSSAAGGSRHQGSRNLPILAVDLLWTIQVRPTQVNEGTTKHGEMALREILCMYRNLSLLAKARDPHRSAAVVVPWHLDCTTRSARALNECHL